MKRSLGILIFIIVLVTAACNDGPVGIFASIASEAKVTYTGTEAFKKATPSNVVKREETLYAVITKLWKKNGTKWEKVASLPANAFYASAAVVNVTTLYVSFLDSSAHALGVYSTIDDNTWLRVDQNFPASGEQVQQLLTVNNNVFAVTSTKGADDKTEYVLYELNGNIFEQRKAGGTNLFYVVYHSSTYYVASGANVWTTSDFTSYSEPASLTLSENDYVTGLAVIDSKPTVTTASGKVYWFDGSNWQSTAALKVANNELYLSSMVEHNSHHLIIATNSVTRKVGDTSKTAPAAGYVELDLPLITTSTQKETSALSTATQTNFSSTIGTTALSMLVMIDNTLYAGSVGNGLWSNKYNGSSWSGWQRETD